MVKKVWRHEYRAALEEVVFLGGLKNHGMHIFPHLTQEQQDRLVFGEEVKTPGGVIVALPPVKVRGALWVVRCIRDQGGNFRCEAIDMFRQPNSYHHVEISDRIVPSADIPPALFLLEAVDHAEREWGQDLVDDTWLEYGVVTFQDPNKIMSPYHQVLNLAWTTTRRWKSRSDDWDAALAEMSLSPIEGREMQGERAITPIYHNCAYCGYGLTRRGCENCGRLFVGMDLLSGWQTPIPPKMEAFLRSFGRRFAMDPAIGRQKEASRF